VRSRSRRGEERRGRHVRRLETAGSSAKVDPVAFVSHKAHGLTTPFFFNTWRWRRRRRATCCGGTRRCCGSGTRRSGEAKVQRC
jgi:hypothetical protein